MPRLLWTIKERTGPVARVGHAMAYDARRRRIVMFGGTAGALPLADTWEWNEGKWTQVNDIGPAARFGHAIAYDAARAVVVLFGGGSGENRFGDTWEWDGADWTQVADSGPSPRTHLSLAFGGVENGVILFGGQDDGGLLGDTWNWNGEEWMQLQDTGPASRRAHVMAFDSQRNRIVLFGGETIGEQYSDTWEWDGSVWTQVARFGPPAAAAGSLVFDGQSCLLYGGVAAAAMPPAMFHSIWQWNGRHWTARQNMGPGARWDHAMAFDQARSRGVLFGGTASAPGSAVVALGDTWEQFQRGTALQELPVQPPDVPPDYMPGSAPSQIASLEVIPSTPVEGERFQVVANLNPPGTGLGEYVDFALSVPGITDPLHIFIMIGGGDATSVFTVPLFADLFRIEASLNASTAAVNFEVIRNSTFTVTSLTLTPLDHETGVIVNVAAGLNAPATQGLDVALLVKGPTGNFLASARAEPGSGEAHASIPIQSWGDYTFEARLGGATVSAVLIPPIASLEVNPASPLEGERFQIVATLKASAPTIVHIPFRIPYPDLDHTFHSVIEIPAGTGTGIFAFPHSLFAGTFSIEASLNGTLTGLLFNVTENPTVHVTSLTLNPRESDSGPIVDVIAGLNQPAADQLDVPILMWGPDSDLLDYALAEPASTEAHGWFPLGSSGEYSFEARLGGARVTAVLHWAP